MSIRSVSFLPSCSSCGSLLLFKVESEHYEDAWGCESCGVVA